MATINVRPRLSGLAFVLALAVPWSMQVFTGRDATLLFAWGLVNTNPYTVVTLPEFLFVYTQGLPGYIRAWPLSVGLYGLAAGSAVVGWRLRREDSRVTAGLLVCAAVLQAQLAWGFSLQPNRVAWPIGSVVLVVVAAIHYRATGGARRGDAPDAD